MNYITLELELRVAKMHFNKIHVFKRWNYYI